MNEKLLQFEKTVDAACKSKFIMIDKRVSDILKSVAACPEIFEATRSAMIGFDFGRELKIATSVEGHFALPVDDQRVVGLVFCLLAAIDDKKIDVSQLLSKHFGGEDPYAKFANEVLVRFKEAVLRLSGAEDAPLPTKTKQEVSPALLERAAFLAGQLDEHIKPKAKPWLEGFLRSISLKDKQLILIFFDLLKKQAKRSGKKLFEELAAVIQVVEEQ